MCRKLTWIRSQTKFHLNKSINSVVSRYTAVSISPLMGLSLIFNIWINLVASLVNLLFFCMYWSSSSYLINQTCYSDGTGVKCRCFNSKALSISGLLVGSIGVCSWYSYTVYKVEPSTFSLSDRSVWKTDRFVERCLDRELCLYIYVNNELIWSWCIILHDLARKVITWLQLQRKVSKSKHQQNIYIILSQFNISVSCALQRQ